MEYLELDLMNPRGFVRRSGKPRATQVPMALTDDGQPVYGVPESKPVRATLQRFRLMVYDDEVERQRRHLADTALAQLMVEKPRYALRAVQRVAGGIREWWARKQPTLTQGKLIKPIASSATYVYGATSYGRLARPSVMPQETDTEATADLQMLTGIVQGWLRVLQGEYLPQMMSLIDYFGRVFKALGPSTRLDPSPETQRYEAMLRKVRPHWYEDKDLRGRLALADHHKKMREKDPNFRGSGAKLSHMPGLITTDFTIPISGPLSRAGLDLSTLHLEGRNRGIDMFLANAVPMEERFKRSLGDANLNFSASASGTTATIYASGAVFADLDAWPLEDKKEFMLGCLAYLVAGGMHTCHEVFWTSRLLGLPYADGKFNEVLPRIFMQSLDYGRWSGEFWEFVRPDRARVR